MVSLPAIDTFRAYDFIKHAYITILIDSDNMNNFIQPRVAKFLNLPVEDTLPFRVMVGNGSVMDCQQLCPETALQIQSHNFIVTLRVLPLSETDVILGVEWLCTLDPIVTDYTSFTMNFTHLGQPIRICADVHTEPAPVSAQYIRWMIHTHSTSALFHLSLLTMSQPEPPTYPIHPISAIEDLLLKFHTIFQ